jgi:diguanylate cyclase (GGDEF)-like protein
MRKTPILMLAIVSYGIFYFLWLTFSPELHASYVSGLFAIAAPLFSLLLQFHIYNTITGPRRNFVFLFIMGTLSYLIAELIWNYQMIFLYSNEELPYPGISDLFYFSNSILFIVAFFYLVSRNSQRLRNFNFLLDLIIIYSTIVVLLTMEVFVPMFEASGFTLLEIIVSTLYPSFVLLLLISMVICFVYQHIVFERRTMFLFMAAIFLQFLGDTVFTVAVYLGMFHNDSFLEPIWSISILLFGLAIFSLAENKTEESKQIVPVKLSYKWSVSRMFTQSGCILTLLYLVVSSNYHDVYKYVLFGTILLVLLRQILSSYQNHKLLTSLSEMKADLEQKVIDRTHQLSSKNEDLKIALDKINYMALHDDLTGLPNRRALHEKLKELIEETKPFTLIFIDVNKFKEINDTLGHHYGDKMLQTISRLLNEATKDLGTVYRQSGDEFIITIETIDQASIEDTISRINQYATFPIRILQSELAISFSIGIAQYPTDATTIDEIINLADIAMYKAKKKDHNSNYSLSN